MGYLKLWQNNNKAKLKEYSRKRNSNRKHNITKEEWDKCKMYFKNECAYCGLHIDNHLIHINGNIKLVDFHKEHVNPNGKNDLSNCVPSCRNCNSSKHTDSLTDWYTEMNPRFNKDRLSRINNWLEGEYLKK